MTLRLASTRVVCSSIVTTKRMEVSPVLQGPPRRTGASGSEHTLGGTAAGLHNDRVVAGIQ